MIQSISTAGAIPALEMTLKFAGARQRVISHNIGSILRELNGKSM